MSIWNAAKTTTVAALTTVDSAARAVTHAADSVAALTETAAAYAQNYRDDAIEELAVTAGHRRTLRVKNAKLNLAKDLRRLEEELARDPNLMAVFSELDDKLFEPKSLRVAAE